jgi:di/tricarboxylate transporter
MSNTAAAAVFIPVAASLATTIPLDIVGILIVTIMSTLLVPIVFAP